MTYAVERVAQWVIEARDAQYTAECRHPFVDAPCSYDHTAGALRFMQAESVLPRQLADEIEGRAHVKRGDVNLTVHVEDHTLAECAGRFRNTVDRLHGFRNAPIPEFAL